MGVWTRRNWMTLAAAGGFIAVAVGAFATHGVQDPRAQEWLRTGAMYGFMHTMATFACATFMNIGARRAGWRRPSSWAGWCCCRARSTPWPWARPAGWGWSPPSAG